MLLTPYQERVPSTSCVSAFLLLLSQVIGPAVLPASAVEVHWVNAAVPGVVPASDLLECSGVVKAESAGSSGGVERSVEFRPGEVFNLGVESDREWSLSFSLDSCWAPKLVVDPGVGQLEVPVWPKVRLAVPVREGHDLTELSIRLRSPPPENGADFELWSVPETAVSCEFVGGECLAEVPAAPLDLRIEAAGFIPSYRWGIQPSIGELNRLKPLTLQRGASVSGWIGGANIEYEKVSVILRSSTIAESSDPTQSQNRSWSEKVVPNRRGFFQFSAVAPGEYRLEAHGPGFAAPMTKPFFVAKGTEVLFDHPLEMEILADLHLRIDPPFGPLSMPWLVRIRQQMPASRRSVTIAEGVTGGDGSFIQESVAPGQYSVEVWQENGDLFRRDQVAVEGGYNYLPIFLSMIPIRGEVFLGRSPMAAKLRFEKRMDNSRVFMESDEHGHFEGQLPSGGDWEVFLFDDQMVRFLGRHEVTRRQGEPFAYIELSLPGTRIQGTVVDEDDQPVPRFVVSLTRPPVEMPELQIVSTETGGKFEILGVQPGEILLRADTSIGDSVSVQLNVREDEELDPIKLVVRRKREIRGQVFSQLGGVSGALIRVFERGPGLFWEKPAGPSGKFNFTVSSSAPGISLVVIAAGFPVRILRVVFPFSTEDVSIEISVGVPKGRILLPVAGDYFLIHNGAAVQVRALLRPGWLHNSFDPASGTVAIEAEAGEYSLCFASGESHMCSSGVLADGGFLELSVGAPVSSSSLGDGDDI